MPVASNFMSGADFMAAKGYRTGWLLGLILAFLSGGVAQQSNSVASKPPLSVEEVVKNLQEKNQERAEALRQFQSTRIYRMQYRGFPSDRDAEMTVQVNYQSPDKKEFTVISQNGSKFIIKHVFKKLLEGEQEAANQENQRRTALSIENYDFRMDGYENTSSGAQYVLEVAPKTHNKFLYRGKIWVDANDFAVTRIEAEPASNPSFWIKKTDVEHRYQKVQGFWLPAENHSESFLRLGGRAMLTIEYKDYRVIAARPVNGIKRADQDLAMVRIFP